MKSYLRLLFVGSVLLIVLGFYNEQNRNMEIHDSASAGIEQTLIKSALLPYEPVPSAPILSSVHCPSDGKLVFFRYKLETYLSRQSDRRIQIAKRVVNDISPDLLFRTGGFIYSQSKTEVPS